MNTNGTHGRYTKYLVAGATGKTGQEIVRCLVNRNIPVRIVVRNKVKAREMFKDIYEKINQVYECEFGILQIKCEFNVNNYGDVLSGLQWCDVLVDAIGAGFGEDPQRVDYISTVELIKLCQMAHNNLFVLISS